MSLWINSTKEERLVMLQQVAARMKFADSAAEKDWWVTLTLKAIFMMPIGKYMLFKGGTSLSKGWYIISRFSEDIDLILSRKFFADVKHLPCAACANNQQVKLLRKASRDYIVSEFCPALEGQLNALGIQGFRLKPVLTKPLPNGAIAPIDHDSDPTVIKLEYDSIAENRNAYVQPTVKIEISCLGMEEPFEVRRITSLVYDLYPDEDSESAMEIPTVLPSRTFLEKAFLLNEEFQRAKPRSLRMSRHLYDLEKLMDTPFAKDALQNKELYLSIIAHRKQFYHVGGVNYEKNLPQRINFIPHGELDTQYRSDYEDMLATYIYDHNNAPTYEELIQRIQILIERFRNCNWNI